MEHVGTAFLQRRHSRPAENSGSAEFALYQKVLDNLLAFAIIRAVMPQLRQCRTRRLKATPPIENGAALDDLRFIRQTLENSTSFTAVPGWGMVGMAGIAVLAAAIAWQQPGFDNWCVTWLVAASVALSTALVTMHRKATRAGVSLFTGPGRKFMLSFLP